MPLNDLLGEAFETEDTHCWDRERTANAHSGVRRPPAFSGTLAAGDGSDP